MQRRKGFLPNHCLTWTIYFGPWQRSLYFLCALDESVFFYIPLTVSRSFPSASVITSDTDPLTTHRHNHPFTPATRRRLGLAVTQFNFPVGICPSPHAHVGSSHLKGSRWNCLCTASISFANRVERPRKMCTNMRSITSITLEGEEMKREQSATRT